MFLGQPPAVYTPTPHGGTTPSRNPAPWAAMTLAAAVLVFMGIAPGYLMQAANTAIRALGL